MPKIVDKMPEPPKGSTAVTTERVLVFHIEDELGLHGGYNTFHEAFSKKHEGDKVTHSWMKR